MSGFNLWNNLIFVIKIKKQASKNKKGMNEEVVGDVYFEDANTGCRSKLKNGIYFKAKYV